jgi:hypothetical protein
MFTQNQLNICNELVELYKAQLPFVEPEHGQEWTVTDLELFRRRAERISDLQRQLASPDSTRPAALRVRGPIISGSWQDR